MSARSQLLPVVPVLAIAALSLINCPRAGAATNILQNGGFETGLLDPSFQDNVFTPSASWETASAASLAGDPSISVFSGNYSASVNGNNELRHDFAAYGTSSVRGDEVIEASLYAAHPDTTATNLLVSVFYDAGAADSQNFQTVSSGWEKIDFTSLIDPVRNVTGFSFYGNNSGRTFVDNFTLQIPEPGSAALFGLGALLVAVRRRR